MDLINGLFELAGGYFVWLNFMALRKERKVVGVYWPATLVFSLWGLWNLIYYPSLGQWISCIGGVSIVAGNACWLGLLYKIKRLEKKVIEP